jgi:peptidoglycan hydrolase-like protein with peptidoglycan-binding domain
VVNLQSALRQRGYYQNPNITGYFGPQTAEAVRAFQRDRGFAHSGAADPQTLAALGLPEDPLPPATV